MNRVDLKNRRNEAIKSGRVFNSTCIPIYEATDWTYRDFRDATQILINRLTQLLHETDTDNPGEQEAKLMRDVSNMAKVWSDKVVKVFWHDEPVKDIEDPEMSDEPAISSQFINAVDRLIYDWLQEIGQSSTLNTEIKDKKGSQYLYMSFIGESKHGWNLETVIDIFRFNGKLALNMFCRDVNDNDAKLAEKAQSSNMNLILEKEDANLVLDKIQSFYNRFEEIYGMPEGELMVANASLDKSKYRMSIDEDVLNVVTSSNIDLINLI